MHYHVPNQQLLYSSMDASGKQAYRSARGSRPLSRRYIPYSSCTSLSMRCSCTFGNRITPLLDSCKPLTWKISPIGKRTSSYIVRSDCAVNSSRFSSVQPLPKSDQNLRPLYSNSSAAICYERLPLPYLKSVHLRSK